MSQKPNVNIDLKSESDRLCQDNEALASKYNDLIASSSKQTHHHHHHHHHNYLNSDNPDKEEAKSHNKVRNSNFHSLSQHSPQMNLSQEMQSNNNNNNNNNSSNSNITNLNQRYSHQNMTRSTTSPLLYQNPPFHQHHTALSSSTISSKSNLKSENLARHPVKPKASSSSSSLMMNNMMGFSQSSSSREDTYRPVHHSRQDQQDRETNEVVTMIREELEDDLDGFKESELETLGSLEKNLPVELSFLIRQQAYCMARMNYLDRQLRELKEVRQTNVPPQQANLSSNQSHRNSNNIINAATSTANNNTTTTTTHTKNGNFIPSDDSGGEYSRATISDDDELSSLLDQIAKSVRPERNVVNPNHARTNHPRTNYSNITSQQPQPQYAIINPAQLHQQAVPVFVMGPQITLAHPSSINSNVLPGVHFQPEARYNQYYEEFYAPTNNSSTLHRPNGGQIRLQQFDNSISAIEQLVSQKEKRQITSQLKSADNWLKMRSSGLGNLNSNFSNTNNRTSTGDGTGSVTDRNPAAPSAPENSSNSVIDESRGR